MHRITHNDCKVKALGSYLCEWSDLDYDEVIEALELDCIPEDEDEDKKITVWEPFENHPTKYVAECIENEYWSLCRFAGLENEN